MNLRYNLRERDLTHQLAVNTFLKTRYTYTVHMLSNVTEQCYYV